MTSTHDWPVLVTPLGASAAGAALFRVRKELRLTVVAKAQLRIIHGSDMVPVEAEPIVVDDVHHGGHPGKSVRAPGELSLRLPNVDVLLTGHARSITGPTTSLLARLIVGRDQELLVNKSIRVQGDWPESQPEPTPFEQMPLVYERTLGGLASEDNPAGTSAPNLLDPRGRPRAACFGPIARRWPVRALLEGESALDEAVKEIAESFDWSYFQAAPRDQQTSELRGGEVLIVEGLHPTIARVESRLPMLYGAARLYGAPPDPGRVINLRADTLNVDMDRMIATVLFRGDVSVEGLDLSTIAVAAGVALAPEPLPWPTERPALKPAPAKPAPGARPVQATMELRPGSAGGAPVLPFGKRAEPVRRTMELRPEDALRAPKAALPFGQRPAGEAQRSAVPAAPPAPKRDLDLSDRTVELTSDFVAQQMASAKVPLGNKPAPRDMSAFERTLDLPPGEAAARMAQKLPFAERPKQAPPGATVELDPRAIAALTPDHVLPFDHGSSAEPVSPPAPVSAPIYQPPPPPPSAPVSAPIYQPPPPPPSAPVSAPIYQPPPPPLLTTQESAPVEAPKDLPLMPVEKAPPAPPPDAEPTIGRKARREKKIDLAGHFLSAVDEVERSSKDEPPRR